MSSPSSTSTIAAARAALYALLLAGAPPATAVAHGHPARPVQISFGPPATEDMEVVALLGVRDPAEDVGALGARRREEEYEIEVGVKVHNPAAGAGSEAAMLVDARGFELAEWVRSVVHGHWTLNGTVRAAGVTRQITEGVQLADRGALIFLLLTVACEASVVDAGAAP
jgi:hypothetical protein